MFSSILIIFCRSIRHFMLQGGDPTGTGSGGDSYWGGTFKVLLNFFSTDSVTAI
jgi:cyclophilin family peptidyl-prolyl cis-trans isomerase